MRDPIHDASAHLLPIETRETLHEEEIAGIKEELLALHDVNNRLQDATEQLTSLRTQIANVWVP